MKKNNSFLKENCKQFKNALKAELSPHSNITHIMRKLVIYVDNLLLHLFEEHHLDDEDNIALIALGSYGRQEIQLYSDIDLILVHTEIIEPLTLHRAQAFIQSCWDAGLQISHQITCVSACAMLAKQDHTILSTLLDMRLLCGNATLMDTLHYEVLPLHMWPSSKYFFAKKEEQRKRYEKYDETAYNLEPNIKYGPGGLRDLQLILNIAKRHFSIKKLSEGIAYHLITDKEYASLLHCQHFLWKVRFVLHAITGKSEERLLFDYQLQLAHFFNYQNNECSLAIEQFMKVYFNVIEQSRELTEMLRQHLEEIITPPKKKTVVILDKHFQLVNQYIEVSDPLTFLNQPWTLLKLFVWLAKRSDIQGISISTIRLIHKYNYLINSNFRASPLAIETFRYIFQASHPFIALHYMSKHHVLGHYLPCFALITGQMQYDLFHVYTVEQHTLFIIRNIERFSLPAFASQFPLAFELMNKIKTKEVLYLAALFHDIAKGRGGDHAILGAIEAKNYAEKHYLGEENTHLLIWLVVNHLLMSQTAQRKDIHDIKIIQQFCNKLPHPDYLEYLYLLTVADICATNPQLWNSWKDSLLKELYHASQLFFQQSHLKLDENILIQTKLHTALEILIKKNISSAAVQALWQHFKDKYFLNESAENIVVHTEAILQAKAYPLILILPHSNQGGTQVFIYMPHRDERFIITTTILHNHQITIQEAAILTCENHFDLDIYVVLNEKQQNLLTTQQTINIKNDLAAALKHDSKLPLSVKRRQPRYQSHFKIEPQVSFYEDIGSLYTELFLVTADTSGLLAKVSYLFYQFHIQLHQAKIATAGERVEDMFYLTNDQGGLLSLEEKKVLQEKLLEIFK